MFLQYNSKYILVVDKTFLNYWKQITIYNEIHITVTACYDSELMNVQFKCGICAAISKFFKVCSVEH